MSLPHFEIIHQFQNYITESGIPLSGDIIPDGKIHRFKVDGDKPGTKHGAYQLHVDGRPNGWAESHRTGQRVVWKLKGKVETISAAQRKIFAENQAKRQLEILNLQRAAASECRKYWKTLTGCPGDRYLIAKKIKPHRSRRGIYTWHDKETGKPIRDFEALVIPIIDETVSIATLQYIFYYDGRFFKSFHKDTRKAGCCLPFGVPTSTILIAEGFATAASLYEATDFYTICALDAGNLEPVSRVIREKYPTADIVLCADNDSNGVGQKAAETAAMAVNGRVIIPPDVDTDFNDFIQAGGVVEL